MFFVPNPNQIAYDQYWVYRAFESVWSILSLQGIQVWEDTKVKVGPVWKVCMESFTRTCFGQRHQYPLTPLNLNHRNLTLIFLYPLLHLWIVWVCVFVRVTVCLCACVTVCLCLSVYIYTYIYIYIWTTYMNRRTWVCVWVCIRTEFRRTWECRTMTIEIVPLRQRGLDSYHSGVGESEWGRSTSSHLSVNSISKLKINRLSTKTVLVG